MNGFASISLLERDFAKQLREGVNTKVTHKNQKSEQVT